MERLGGEVLGGRPYMLSEGAVAVGAWLVVS